MSIIELIQAVKEGDIAKAKEFLKGEVDINGHGDEQRWTPLNYASGKGNLDMVRLLLENGADVFNIGSDLRTPYEIALAAGHIEVAQQLRNVEDKVDPEQAKTSSRRVPKYCKAYYLRDLRQFPTWTENKINRNKEKQDTDIVDTADESAYLLDDSIVFLHTDFTVTESMWHNENVVFDKITEDWKTFCSEVLKFKVPDDFELDT